MESIDFVRQHHLTSSNTDALGLFVLLISYTVCLKHTGPATLRGLQGHKPDADQRQGHSDKALLLLSRHLRWIYCCFPVVPGSHGNRRDFLLLLVFDSSKVGVVGLLHVCVRGPFV